MRVSVAILLLLGIISVAGGQENPPIQQAVPQSAGLQVGTKRHPPSLCLIEFGHEQSNDTLKGSKGIIIFFGPPIGDRSVKRSSCSCKTRNRGLKHRIKLAAISYDSPAILKDFAKRHKIEFPLLSDADFGNHSEVQRAEHRSEGHDQGDGVSRILLH